MDELTQFCGCSAVASWFRVCAYVLSETILDVIWVNSGTAFAVAASENRNQFSYRVGSACDVCDGALFPLVLRKRDKLCFAGTREKKKKKKKKKRKKKYWYLWWYGDYYITFPLS